MLLRAHHGRGGTPMEWNSVHQTVTTTTTQLGTVHGQLDGGIHTAARAESTEARTVHGRPPLPSLTSKLVACL